MFFEDAKKSVEFIGVVESDAGFHGEGKVAAGFPEHSKKMVDVIRITKESTAGILAINHRGWATEIEIDPGNGMLFEIVNGADEFIGVLADHLSDHRTTGGIFGDRAKNVGIEI